MLFYLFPTSELYFYFISCNRTRPRHSAGRMEGSILETCVLGRLLCGVRWALAGICPSSENVWCGGCKGAGDSGSPHLFPLVAVELFASLLSLFLLLVFSLLSYFLSLRACRAGFKSCGFVWVSWVPPLPIGFYFVSVWRTPTGRFCAILKDSRKARHAVADFASRRNYHAKGIYVPICICNALELMPFIRLGIDLTLSYFAQTQADAAVKRCWCRGTASFRGEKFSETDEQKITFGHMSGLKE